MILRSGRTYPREHLDMEGKLDRIFKELPDLKIKIEVLENEKERSRGDTRDRSEENTNKRRDDKDNIIRRIKIDHLTFDSILD